MVARSDLYFRFEDSCSRLLAELNFEVRREVRLDTDFGVRNIDILAYQDGRTYVVEVKWSRYESVDLQRLRDWSAKAAGLRSKTHACLDCLRPGGSGTKAMGRTRVRYFSLGQRLPA